MSTLKCPIQNCHSQQLKIQKIEGKNFLVCDQGHPILMDCSEELKSISQSANDATSNLSVLISGISTAIKTEGAALRKQIKDELEKFKT
jgi:hypothetical protein